MYHAFNLIEKQKKKNDKKKKEDIGKEKQFIERIRTKPSFEEYIFLLGNLSI